MTTIEYWSPVITAALLFVGIAIVFRMQSNAMLERAKGLKK